MATDLRKLRVRPVRGCAAVFLLGLGALGICLPAAAVAAGGRGAHGPGSVEMDVRSEYSHILVKRQGNVRMMIFVRDSGEEVVESMVNLKKPYELIVPYSRFMFCSYLFRPECERVLIVGLGGGAMVQFLQHYDPDVKVEAVEIDPAVVDLADRYFKTRSGGNTRIVTDDAFHYFQNAKARYDVIYMDAFLKPSRDTDATGVPLQLKTIRFYKSLQDKIVPGGLVVFNLNVHSALNDDIAAIREAFPQVYVFRALNANAIAIGSTDKSRVNLPALRERAKDQDRRFKATFSFQELLNNLAK